MLVVVEEGGSRVVEVVVEVEVVVVIVVDVGAGVPGVKLGVVGVAVGGFNKFIAFEAESNLVCRR